MNTQKIPLALLFGISLLMLSACDRDDDISIGDIVTTSTGLMNGEEWTATSYGTLNDHCSSTSIFFRVRTEDGIVAQTLGVYVYEVSDAGEYPIFDRAYNDDSKPNCSRWPDTVSTLLSTSDDDLITAFYNLAPELGPCTLRLDSVNADRSFYAGEINAHYVNPGYDTRRYEMQLPDTVHFEGLRFEINRWVEP